MGTEWLLPWACSADSDHEQGHCDFISVSKMQVCHTKHTLPQLSSGDTQTMQKWKPASEQGDSSLAAASPPDSPCNLQNYHKILVEEHETSVF